MAREGLTGSRIRERRVISGLKQADLARQVGISASYLNLIEHNRRRIGGKLLLDIARVLSVEPAALTEGAEAALIATLRDAAAKAGLAAAEAERAEELAGRFPGWADVISTIYRRIGALERTVETLSDRLGQDPQLAASVHEVLSTAASIRSTASILVAEQELTPEWRNRFHANIDQDSRRLASSSKALVSYLDAAEGDTEAASSPQEEVEAFFAARDYRFPAFERGEESLDALIEAGAELRSGAARQIARGILEGLAQDAERVPSEALEEAVLEFGIDPIALARHFDATVACVMRRYAALPERPSGLIVCDRAGSLIFRKPVTGFDIPRYGAACPLWPLFQAIAAPGQVIAEHVVHLGRSSAEFRCIAVAEPVGNASFNRAPLLNATMLVVPMPTGGDAPASDHMQVGSTCRVCPKAGCDGRREPSILREGL